MYQPGMMEHTPVVLATPEEEIWRTALQGHLHNTKTPSQSIS
jgi:predicted ATPase